MNKYDKIKDLEEQEELLNRSMGKDFNIIGKCPFCDKSIEDQDKYISDNGKIYHIRCWKEATYQEIDFKD